MSDSGEHHQDDHVDALNSADYEEEYEEELEAEEQEDGDGESEIIEELGPGVFAGEFPLQR